MTNKTIIVGLVVLAFVTGTMMTETMAYAEHKPGHQSNAGGVPDLQTQIDENTAAIDSFFDVFVELAELDAEEAARIAADDALRQALNDEIARAIAAEEQLARDLAAEASARQTADEILEGLVDENSFRIDSFFDIFTEISVHNEDIRTIDTEIVALQLQGNNQQTQIDSFFDITVNLQRQIDSFFDIFTEISVHNEDIDTVQTEIVALSLSSVQGDTDLQRQLDGHVTVLKAKDDAQDTEIARIDTEILSMDLRGESCNVGDVVTGVDSLGNLVCAPDSGSAGNSWTVLTDVPEGFADGVDNVDDADNDPTNEIQTLSIIGQDLSISGANTVELPTNPQLGSNQDLFGTPGGSSTECLIGEVRLFASNFVPRGFYPAEGDIIPIVGNESLFSLIGTTFGGDGRSTFGLPDLRAVEPNSVGSGNDDVSYIICSGGIFPPRN